MQRFMTSLPSKNQQAFTLVELLITVMIIVISLSIGVTNYLRFLDKQRLYQAGSNIEAMLKDARTKAQNGFLGNDEIGFCAQLAAVEVSSALTSESLVAAITQVRCADGTLLTYENYLIGESNTLFDKNFKVSFLPMRGATILLDSTQVASGAATLSRSGSNVIFNFDQGGTIDVKYE